MEPAMQWPDSERLRVWQERALRRFIQCQDAGDFLAVGTPGSGKTTFALRVAHMLLSSNSVERVVVVCPTEHLKEQWATAAAKVGIHLQPDFTNDMGCEGKDYHGVVLTYQQVGMQPDLHRRNSRRNTLAIFDEIHHAGEGQTWATGVRHAFEFATQRLCLSGTPFRTDNNPIPFITYENGRSKADFCYTYADALADGDVCRPVLFPSYEGRMEWYSSGATFSATFEDELADKQASERLNTALDPKGNWLPTVLRQANDKLTDLRAAGHRDAAGLVICKDQDHARLVAPLIQKITGEAPTVAMSDEPESSRRIHYFATGRNRWIVAVRMVSEGVDIPRLRLCVYATNYLTEMYFRQAVGRIVRWIAGLEEQSAYFYIPKVDELVRWAQRVKEERDHELQQELERQRRARETAAKERLSTFHPIASDAKPDAVIFDEAIITQDELLEAETIREQANAPSYLPTAVLARLLRVHAERLSSARVGAQAKPQVPPTPPLHEQKRKAKTLIRHLVNQLVEITNQEHREVYRRLIEHDGARMEDATLEQLQARIELLGVWLGDVRDGA